MRKHLILGGIALLLGISPAKAQSDKSTVHFMNPSEVAKPNGYSQAAVINLGSNKMIILSGQVPLNAKGELIVDVQHPPASTLVQVRSFFRDDVLLEMEATAVIPAHK